VASQCRSVSTGLAEFFVVVGVRGPVEQDLTRQSDIEHTARQAGYYIAGVYREKASGARADQPELLRMISDLQSGEAEQLVASIRAKGARLAVPGLVDFSDIAPGADEVTRIVLEATQALLLKLALQMARDDYEIRRERQRQGVALARSAGKYAGRRADTATHECIVALRRTGLTIKRTAELAGCSLSQVKRIWALHQAQA
jgi:DNA invertase Pin-like site-specific DNA recombinase